MGTRPRERALAAHGRTLSLRAALQRGRARDSTQQGTFHSLRPDARPTPRPSVRRHPIRTLWDAHVRPHSHPRPCVVWCLSSERKRLHTQTSRVLRFPICDMCAHVLNPLLYQYFDVYIQRDAKSGTIRDSPGGFHSFSCVHVVRVTAQGRCQQLAFITRCWTTPTTVSATTRPVCLSTTFSAVSWTNRRAAHP